LSMCADKWMPSLEMLPLSFGEIHEYDTKTVRIDSCLVDDDEINSGVRELSDDENGLRELDANDMNDTDEFIVFASNIDPIEDNQEYTSSTPRANINRLYAFARHTDHGINTTQQRTCNQVCSNIDMFS
jgi:hypothetical protein